MEQVHEACRRRHLSKRTEEAFRLWIRQFIYFHNKRHPQEIREQGVKAFINHLAAQRQVSASTQSQALNALVFLFRDVLLAPLDEISGLARIQRPHRTPVVMVPEEVNAVLSKMSGTTALMARLMYAQA